MRKQCLQLILATLVPVALLAMGPANIMLCKMGMAKCAPCCPEMFSRDIPQVSQAKNCCSYFSRDWVASSKSSKATDFSPVKYGLALILPHNPEAHALIARLGSLNLESRVHHPPLFLLKTSLRC